MDVISRQKAIDAMYGLVDESRGEWAENPHIDAIIEAIENIPSSTITITVAKRGDILRGGD